MSRLLRVLHRPIRAIVGHRWVSIGSPVDAYNALVTSGSIQADKVQLMAITQLQQLYEKILDYKVVGK